MINTFSDTDKWFVPITLHLAIDIKFIQTTNEDKVMINTGIGILSHKDANKINYKLIKQTDKFIVIQNDRDSHFVQSKLISFDF